MVLSANTTLTQIDLGFNNEVTSQGWLALLKGLRSNTSVTHINLSGCRIGDEGATFLASALLTNTTLAHIDLSGQTGITDCGWKDLLEGLKMNRGVASQPHIINQHGAKIWVGDVFCPQHR